MPATVNDHSVLVTPEEQAHAAAFIDHMNQFPSEFRTTDGIAFPPEINAVLGKVLTALRNDAPISISTMPSEVTTTTAASMLGMSRPTLMKQVRSGRISAHKVGSHHKLFSKDVLEFREVLKQEKRQAVFDLLDAEEDLGNNQ